MRRLLAVLGARRAAAVATLAVAMLVSPVIGSASEPDYEDLIRNRRRVCGIQFDDGHISHYTIGFPKLQQYNFIGSFGIVTGNTDNNPIAMTTAMLQEMVLLGHHFQDHTKDHNSAFWGDPSNAALWGAHCIFSQGVFAGVGIAPMCAWNQPGGTGEGFTSILRDTLIAHGYLYAAGRVGLTNNQFRNMHFGSIDDPFSWGRWCYSWTYNAPAVALEARGIEPDTPRGRELLEVIVASVQRDETRSDGLLLEASPEERLLVREIAADWSWQAEVEVIKTRYADAWAQGGLPIIVFHRLNNVPDDGAAQGLDALCAWLVDNDAVVLGMDYLNRLALTDRSYQHGVNIAAPLDVDLNGDGRPDGFDPYVYIDMSGLANNGAGTYLMGTPPGGLVVTATISTPFQTGATDDFWTVYERFTIDPHTWAYTREPAEMRLHTIHQGETLTFVDTLTIADRVDRVKFWIQGINTQPFVFEELSAVPLARPSGVSGRTSSADLLVTVTPNPSDRQTRVAFHLDRQTRASVAVYDVRGRLIARLIDRSVTGAVAVDWDGTDSRGRTVPNGVYFVQVVAGSSIGRQKIMLIR